MSTFTFKGTPHQTAGTLPEVGKQAPDFELTLSNFTSLTLADLTGKKAVLNIFPSIDTGVCAASVRKFNELAAGLENTTVVCISKDLPFAHKRFCDAEGINGVQTASQFKDQSFSEAYGVDMLSGPLPGLMSRAIVVIDANGKVLHTEQVAELAQEPNYDAALSALKG
jgi:thioredoxin-dependent peroxiredoxin